MSLNVKKTIIKYFEAKRNRTSDGICAISNLHNFYQRKDTSEDTFPKRGRKFIQLYDFEQRVLSRLISGFHWKSMIELPANDKTLTKCKDVPGFPNLSASTLPNTYCVKLVTSAETKKIQVYRRHKHLKKVIELISEE